MLASGATCLGGCRTLPTFPSAPSLPHRSHMLPKAPNISSVELSQLLLWALWSKHSKYSNERFIRAVGTIESMRSIQKYEKEECRNEGLRQIRIPNDGKILMKRDAVTATMLSDHCLLCSPPFRPVPCFQNPLSPNFSNFYISFDNFSRSLLVSFLLGRRQGRLSVWSIETRRIRVSCFN